MCDKTILENGGTLKAAPDCYKNQEMWNKAVDNYPHALEFVLKCYKTQKMCEKGFNKGFFAIFVPDRYKTQEMCDRIISEDPFSIKYVPDQSKTQKCVMKLLMIS